MCSAGAEKPNDVNEDITTGEKTGTYGVSIFHVVKSLN